MLFARLCVSKSAEQSCFKHGAVINYYIITAKCDMFSKTGLRFTWNKPAGGQEGLLGQNQLNTNKKDVVPHIWCQKLQKRRLHARPRGRRLLRLLSTPPSPSRGLALLFCAHPRGGLVTLGSQRLSKKTSALCIDCLFTLLKDLQIHAFENLAIFRGPCAVVGICLTSRRFGGEN